MKRTIYFILILALSVSNLTAERISKSEMMKTIKHYQRLMESAQPLPDPKYKGIKPGELPLAPKSKSAIFLNVNTIDDEAGEEFRMQNESSIAVNPTNPMNLIASAVDYRANSSTWVYVSHDGGKTWVNHNLGKPYPGWRSSNDPSVYFSLDGIGYLCYGGFGESIDSFAVAVGENGVFVAKTTDEGKTWKAHIPVIVHKGVQTLDSLFEDKYYVQVDNSPTSPYFRHLYIPWKRVTPRDSATQIVMSKSIDEGETWSIPTNISYRVSGSSEDTTFGQSFPLAATGPLGEVYIVWNHGTEHGVGFAKSYDGGETFIEPRIIHRYNIFGTTRYIDGQGWRHTVKEKVRAEAYPVIVCDITSGPRRGTLYLCWAADNIPNIYFSKSTDEGETWSEPIIVHSDTTNDQFWPWMSIDPLSSDLIIMYFDSRNCPDNMMVECYVSYSSNGGYTWTERRAADQSSNLRLNPFRGNAFAGDYSGCAFYDGIAYPTWVDMRGAVLNIRDSDVFTAIINTRAPLPVEDLQAKIFPEQVNSLELNWVNPTERSFGQPLKDEDYLVHIVRDNQFINELQGGITTYLDTGLTPFKRYNYQVYTVSANDSSNARSVASYPGGSKEPGTPSIITSTGSAENIISLFVSIPSTRADGTTPLVNLQQVAIYRDNIFLCYQSVSANDAGNVIKIIDKTPEVGYYVYSIASIDEFGNESEKSLDYIAFSGEIIYQDAIFENFDSDKLPKYYISGQWTNTKEFSFSKPYSLSNSPYMNYENGQLDTILFFPFVTNSDDYFYVSFFHAAVIANNDYATMEYSTNKGKDWSSDFRGETARWSKRDYPAWSDNVFDVNDWKLEEFKLPNTSDTIYLRLRFFSNLLVNDLGWYVDDFRISNKSVSVKENAAALQNVLVYPNPAREYITIRFTGHNNNEVLKYLLYSTIGNLVLEGVALPDSFKEQRIMLSNVPAGTYYLVVTNSKGLNLRESIRVIR